LVCGSRRGGVDRGWGGGGWWRTTPNGFSSGVCASEASTEHGRDDTPTKK